MRIVFKIIGIFFIFFSIGCVTFNSLDFEKSKEDVKNLNLCFILDFKETNRGSSLNGERIVDLNKLTVRRIEETLKNLSIDTNCSRAEAKKMTVMVNNNTSNVKLLFTGVTSIFTVLSLTIIPTYLSNDMELVLIDGDKQILKREFAFTSAAWLPLVVKQWQDDTTSYNLYNVDSQSAILGIEIGKLLLEYSAIEEKKGI